jgi:hypothetical protein
VCEVTREAERFLADIGGAGAAARFLLALSRLDALLPGERRRGEGGASAVNG